jgi:hypothetical protein
VTVTSAYFQLLFHCQGVEQHYFVGHWQTQTQTQLSPGRRILAPLQPPVAPPLACYWLVGWDGLGWLWLLFSAPLQLHFSMFTTASLFLAFAFPKLGEIYPLLSPSQ